MMTNDRSLPSDLPTQLLIDGEWVDAEASRTFDVINPATEKPLVAIADASVDQGTDALDAAVRAQHSWADTAPRERAEILRKTFNLVTERKDDFARLMTLEMGKDVVGASGQS
jgi:succinate-semialdehyde dehydrogenase/glutarate-semialdehyde dehydrogenase